MKNEIVVQAIVGMHANNFNNNKIEIELFHLFSSKYTRNGDDRFRVCSATKPVYEETQNCNEDWSCGCRVQQFCGRQK